MTLSKKTLGYGFAFVSPAFLGATFIFSRILMYELSVKTVLVYWFSFSTIYVVLLGYALGMLRKPKNKKELMYLCLIGLAEFVSSGASFYANSIVEKTSIIAFLGQFSIVFSLIFGIFLLKENITRRSLIGVLIIIFGGLFFTYSMENAGWQIFGLMLIACMAFALILIFASKVKTLGPFTLLASRNIIAGSMVLLFYPGEMMRLTSFTITPFLIGALFGPCIGYLCRFSAINYLETWRVALLGMLLPIFVTFYDFLAFRYTLGFIQVIAAGVILVGTYLVIKTHEEYSPSNEKKGGCVEVLY